MHKCAIACIFQANNDRRFRNDSAKNDLYSLYFPIGVYIDGSTTFFRKQHIECILWKAAFGKHSLEN